MEKIEITEEEYESLLADQRKLFALEGAGVDNWEGYGDAMQYLNDG